MNKTTKIVLVVALIAGIAYESFALIVQCTSKRSIDVTRQMSCKDGNMDHALNACTENASLVLKSSSPVEFLFITNHLGNPVLTLINLFILITAFSTAVKIKIYSLISIKELIAIKSVLGLILFRLGMQWLGYTYTVNWFKGNPVYNNTAFMVNEDTTPLLWFFVILILIIWSDYLKLQIQENIAERQNA